jgi:small subunit ribosomal protein S9
VNDRPADRYFGREIDLRRIMEPLVVAGVEGRFDVVAKVEGGGVTGQADAVRHGVARALVAFDPELRSKLREAGLLTRDPRAKERKKPGLKRARKAPQYTKR